MSARPVLDLDDPGIGIEADFAREPFLDLRLGHGRLAEAADECTVTWMGVVEGALRRRTEQLGGAVEPIELDKDRPRLLGATPPHRREGAVAVAAPHVSGNPDRRFETHGSSCVRKEPYISSCWNRRALHVMAGLVPAI